MERCLSPVGSMSSQDNSLPYAPSDSPGSSVSTRLKDEYDELLKYAVVVPSYDMSTLPQSLTDFRGSFLQQSMQQQQQQQQHHQQQQQQQQHDPHYPPQAEEEADDEDDSGTEVCEGTDSPDIIVRTEHTTTQTTRKERTTAQPPKEKYTTQPKEKHFLDKVCDDAPQNQRLYQDSEVGDPAAHSPGSEAGGDGMDHTAYGFSMTVDKDVARMEGLMSTWLGDLNRNVLAEFGQSKIRMLEHYKQMLQKEKERHAAEMNRLQNETEGLKELLLTYEQSIERKDEVIANLTRAMQRQCDKFEMAKTFCEWKIRHNDKKREAFATNLAERHYKRVLAQKVWDSWHSLVESKWKQRVEKACQAKAQEVCMTLTNDYETRLASLNEALEGARTEVARLHTERDRYEETMKKAFMRGVCALNLEAMTMFHESGDEDERPSEGQSDPPHPPMDGGPGDMTAPGGLPMTVSQEPIFFSEPHGAPSPRVVTSTGASTSRSTMSQASSRSVTSVSSARTKAGQKGKVISAKLSARSDGSAKGTLGASVPMGLAPPMSSIIVERHQPVTKATIGQAKASQYPRRTGSQPAAGIVQRKIAGQHKHVPHVTPNVQTIKMVE